jgi:hypothetical protein
MMFWQSSLEHLAMWPPRHRCGCQAGLWPRTRRHHLRPLGRSRVIRLPGSLLPSSRRGLGENFGSKVIGPASVPAIEIASAWPAAVLSFLSPGMSRAFSFTPCTSAQVGKSKRATGRGSPSGSSYLECGLTGLLNPTSIWHKTISIVFHKVFPSCFVYWSRPNQLEQTANAAFELLPIASVEDCPLDSQITSLPSRNGRGRRTEWRASNVKWKDDTHPPANIFPTIIFLIYIAREIALQDHRAEIVAEEAAHRELALLLIT